MLFRRTRSLWTGLLALSTLAAWQTGEAPALWAQATGAQVNGAQVNGAQVNGAQVNGAQVNGEAVDRKGTEVAASASSVRFERIVLTDQYYCDGVAAGDINSDGITDVVAGPYWYEGPTFTAAHAFYEPVALPPAESPSNSMFSFVHDFSGDGRPDILVLGRVHKHEAKWYENPGDGAGLWKSHFAFERVRGESPMLVDIRGDGTRQLLCHWDGRWGWIEPDPNAPRAPWNFFPVGASEDWPQFYHGEGVGDINGDGRLDLVVNDGWYEQPTRADSSEWQFHRGKFSQQRGRAQMYVDDVDGDGDQDVVSAVDAHGWGLAWYEQKATDVGARFRERLIMGDRSMESAFGVAFTQPHALDLADIDGDGLNDIVVGKRRWAHGPDGDIEPSATPVVYWFQLQRDGDGDARYVPHLIDDNSGVGVQILAADVNQDGRTDVLTASKLGTFVFINRATDTRQ